MERKYTKEQIAMIVTMWDENSIDAIATAVGLDKKTVKNIAYEIRKAGHPLSKKKTTGWGGMSIIKEVLKERNLIK